MSDGRIAGMAAVKHFIILYGLRGYLPLEVAPIRFIMEKTPRYLTGDKEGIKEFLDKYDVCRSNTSALSILARGKFPTFLHSNILGTPHLLSDSGRSFSSTAMAFSGPATIYSLALSLPSNFFAVRTNASSL